MNSVTRQVKLRVTELTERLLADIPDIRIGVLAHGDYGDQPWLLQRLDLTTDGVQLRQFISNVQDTCGGDAPECYELALHEVRTNFSWSSNTRKRLVIIGDDEPHALTPPRNLRELDWRKETMSLRYELKMVIYSVQAYPKQSKEWFWKDLAEMTGGKHLQLSDCVSIFDFLMAICYLEHGVEFFEAFEQEVRSRNSEGPSEDVSRMLTRLASTSDASVVPAPPRAISVTPAAPRDLTRLVSPMKTKAKLASKRVPRKRLRRAAALSIRPKRESEPFCEKLIFVRGGWSDWQLLASPANPAVRAGWSQFGAGFVRSHVPVPASIGAAQTRVLVELATAPRDEQDNATPLYSAILSDAATNAAVAVLRGNPVLKWRVHGSITRGRVVLLRATRIDTCGHSLSQQRRQLRKSNSYAWNSGRVVCGAGAKDLLTVPPPRARLLAKFLRSL